MRVNYLNVLPDKWIDYAWNPLQFPLGAPYDCDSIMHYTHTSFNIGRTRTLEAVDPARCRLRYRGYPAALPLPVKVPVPDPDQSGQGTDQDPVQLLAADPIHITYYYTWRHYSCYNSSEAINNSAVT